MAWNNLTPAQQAAWKKKNFNSKVRVPQSAIDKLMAGKTKSNNVKKYAGTTSPVMREAMNRFYGKGWDKGVTSKAKPKTGQKKQGPVINRPNINDVPKSSKPKPKPGDRNFIGPVAPKSKPKAQFQRPSFGNLPPQTLLGVERTRRQKDAAQTNRRGVGGPSANANSLASKQAKMIKQIKARKARAIARTRVNKPKNPFQRPGL